MNEIHFTRIVWDALLPLGFYEVKTSTFAGRGDVEVRKPASEGAPFLRSSMLPSVKATAERNWPNRQWLGVSSLKTFEVGSIFRRAAPSESSANVGEDVGVAEEVHVLAVSVAASRAEDASAALAAAVARLPLLEVLERDLMSTADGTYVAAATFKVPNG